MFAATRTLAKARSRAPTNGRSQASRGEQHREREERTIFDSNTSADVEVTSSVILVDKSRLDESGKPKSKGFGFIEFTHHAHALAVRYFVSARLFLRLGGRAKRALPASAARGPRAAAARAARRRAVAVGSSPMFRTLVLRRQSAHRPVCPTARAPLTCSLSSVVSARPSQ